MKLNPESKQNVTAENLSYIAEWCGGEIYGNEGYKYIMVNTGFTDNPNYRTSLHVGDTIEKREDGKFQIWVGGQKREDDLPKEDVKMRTITEDNIAEVAEWCGGKLSSDMTIIYLETGFSKTPGYKCTVGVGDRIEKLPDGKWQIWVGGQHDYDETPSIDREDRPEMLEDEEFNPQIVAITLVKMLFYEKNSDIQLPLEDIYVVWFCKTLQNWKAMVSTNAKDNAYYEVTHNGDKNETYVDRYIKHINAKVVHGKDAVEFTMIDKSYFN